METALSNRSAGFLTPRRNFLCRLVFAFIFLDLLYALFSHTMIHQLESPVLKFPYVDITYWLFHLLKIPEFITHHYIISCCLDILLFACCLLSFFFPSRRVFIVLFFLLYLTYYIIFNSYGSHHTHSKIGILLMPLPFMFAGKRFQFMWEATRYFALFVYADAFLWKLIRLTFLFPDQGILIMKKNLAPYLYYNPYTILTRFYTWLFEHPLLINFLFKTGFILEGVFIIGFFTKKFDKYLFIISLILPVGFFFLSDAFFFELLILSSTLFHFHQTHDTNIEEQRK